MSDQVEARAVQRAQAQELPADILLLECRRRGWVVTGWCSCEACKRAAFWPYPPLADEDEMLPFEVRANDQ